MGHVSVRARNIVEFGYGWGSRLPGCIYVTSTQAWPHQRFIINPRVPVLPFFATCWQYLNLRDFSHNHCLLRVPFTHEFHKG